MENKLLTTYALLAHLKETHKTQTGGLIDIFVPIVQKAISEYAKDKGFTEIKGKNTSEIQTKIKEYFGIEIPLYILGVILSQIDKEVDNKQIFNYFGDGAFIIKSYLFDSIDEDIDTEIANVEILKKDYELFCKDNKYQYDFTELESFIFAQKMELFTTKNVDILSTNYLVPKYVKLKFLDERIFKILSDLYLGGLISTYLELKINTPVTQTELLIDTNFVISLIDLNTEEAFITCSQLYKLCIDMGFKFSILYSTVDQIKILLGSRIRDFSSKDLGIVKEADVFGACIRRNLDKTQLERIRDKIDSKLNELKVDIIHETRIKEIIIESKKSQMYQDLKKARQNDSSALNDAVAYHYIKKRRNNTAKEFSEVKCWFLHNSFSSDYDSNLGHQIHARNMISASELLTLLWLSNPNQTCINNNVISKGGLATYITKYRSVKVPASKTIKAIKEKADNALKHGKIEERDIYNICIRMSEGHLSNGEATALAELPDNEFIEKIKTISKEEKSFVSKTFEQTEQLINQNAVIEKIQNDNAEIIRRLNESDYLNALKDYQAKSNELINIKFDELSVIMNKSAGLYIIAVLVVSFLWIFDKYYSKLFNPILSGLAGFAIMIFSLIFIKFVDHKSMLQCFKFTFVKKFRISITKEIKEKKRNEIELQLKKPLRSDFGLE